MIDAKKFKARREELNLTQAQLAVRAGTRQQNVMEIEAGRIRSTKKIYLFAAVLGLPAHELDDDIPALDDELEQTMTRIQELPTEEQREFVRRSIDGLIEIARQQTPK